MITSEIQRGHIYYRCTKKKVPCSQKYVREENLAEQISKILQKVSLPNSWTKKMIAELNKEKLETERAEFSFSQNLKSQIKDCEEKLDKLLDLQLSGAISTEEYAQKKQKSSTKRLKFQRNGRILRKTETGGSNAPKPLFLKQMKLKCSPARKSSGKA